MSSANSNALSTTASEVEHNKSKTHGSSPGMAYIPRELPPSRPQMATKSAISRERLCPARPDLKVVGPLDVVQVRLSSESRPLPEIQGLNTACAYFFSYVVACTP